MNIVVLCGGTSTERDISLISSEGICKALNTKRHKAILLDVFLGDDTLDTEHLFSQEQYDVDAVLADIRKRSEQLEQIKAQRKEFFGPNVMEACRKADVVFLGLHGANGEDGKVQAVLDLLGIAYTGADYLSSAMAMSKSVTKQIFQATHVPMAKGITVVKGKAFQPLSVYEMSYPCVVKPSCGGSSVGVFYANDEKEYKEALEQAFAYEDELVVEECVKGREFSVGIIGTEALPVIEIIKNKIQQAALQAAKALGLNTYCRVDVLTDAEENCYCLEANTLPGMTPTSLMPQEAAVIGISYPDLCEKLIEVSLAQRTSWK